MNQITGCLGNEMRLEEEGEEGDEEGEGDE